MRPSRQTRPVIFERMFTVGSATAFLALMSAVVWALAVPNLLLK